MINVNDLKKYILKNKLGKIIGYGEESLILQPNKKIVNNDKYICLTFNKYKKNFLKALFSEEKVVHNLTNINNKYKGKFNYLKKYVKIFYIEKMQEVNNNFFSTEIILLMNEITRDHYNFILNSNKYKSIYFFKKFLGFYFYYHDPKNKINKNDKIILKAIYKSLKALDKIIYKADVNFVIDIHKGQFLIYKDKIYCIDIFI